MSKFKIFGLLSLVCIVAIVSISCKTTASSSSDYSKVDTASADNGISDAWKTEYKNWFHVTKHNPNTGDPTGFVEKRHNGPNGYREIYINKIGESANKGSAPYKYPEGTIVVKESYKNKKAWEAKKIAMITTMIKLAPGESPESGDWGYIMKLNGKLNKKRDFCNKCHVYAIGKDYVFMNSDFIASLKK